MMAAIATTDVLAAVNMPGMVCPHGFFGAGASSSGMTPAPPLQHEVIRVSVQARESMQRGRDEARGMLRARLSGFAFAQLGRQGLAPSRSKTLARARESL